jgi:hypothetical protein
LESGFLPSVSPLAFLEAAMLKGWAARGLMRVVVVRVVVPRARRENVRKPDIVGGLVGWVDWWVVDRLIEFGCLFAVKKG